MAVVAPALSILASVEASQERLRQNLREAENPKDRERRETMQSAARMDAVSPEKPKQPKATYNADEFSFDDPELDKVDDELWVDRPEDDAQWDEGLEEKNDANAS